MNTFQSTLCMEYARTLLRTSDLVELREIARLNISHENSDRKGTARNATFLLWKSVFLCAENTSSLTRPRKLIWTLLRVGMKSDTHGIASTNSEDLKGIIRCTYQGNNPIWEDRNKTYLNWMIFCEWMNRIYKKCISIATKWTFLRHVCKYDQNLELKLLKHCGTNLINFIMHWVL